MTNVQDLPPEERVEQLHQRIDQLMEAGEVRKAQIILQALIPVDQAEIFGDLSEDEQKQLLTALPLETVADILEKLEDEQVAQIAGWLPEERLARILDEMEADEAADLIGDLDSAFAVRVLHKMKSVAEISPLLLHPDETAGGLMTSEYLALGRQMWAERALEAIRQWENPHEYLYYFVVAKDGELVGVVSLLKLLRAAPRSHVADLMELNPVTARPDMDQETCAQLMSRYDLTALPVADEAGRLVGVITIDDIVDVIEEEATEDIQRLGGSAPLDKPYLLTSAWEIARRRIGWLLLLFLSGMLTTSVLQASQDILRKTVALSFFIPLLIGTGGNAGSQTTSTIIRALGVGEVDKKDILKVLWHELQVGLLLGLLVAAAGFVRAWLFDGQIDMGLTVALAIGVIVFWSSSVGSLLPLLAALVNVDPALISGPLMSTLVDATGLIIYMGIARLILN